MKTETKGSRRQPKHQSADAELDKINLLKGEFDRIRRGGKFDKTKLLELFEFDVDERGGSSLVRMLGMVKWLRDLHTAPGGLTFLRLERAMAAGRVEKQYRVHVQNLINALFVIIGQASEGDEEAQQQLQALNRIAFPGLYGSRDKIELVAAHQPAAVTDLRHGRELLALMDRISGVVRPKTDGEFLSPNTLIVIKTPIDPFDLKACGDDMVAKVKSHNWNAKTSLTSLAVSVYLEGKIHQVNEAVLRKGIRTEICEQGKPHRGPCWALNISRSRTEWVPFYLPLLPLETKIRASRGTAKQPQAE